MTKPLWKHQKQSIALFKKITRGLDASDPGTGKTRVELERYAARPQPKGRLLILCPKTLMISAWGNDIDEHTPQLTASFAFAEQREEAFKTKTDIVIMNLDGVKWLAKEGRKYIKEFDDLVIDELPAFKHRTSQRSKAMASLRKFFKYRYGLTGTFIAHTVMEAWHQMLILDDGKRLGTSYVALRNRVQVPKQTGPRPEHVKWEDRPGVRQVIVQMISDMSIRHAFEEVMTEVPANHRDEKVFNLSKRAWERYRQMENDCIMALEDKTISAVHKAALRTKLLQIASGAVYDINGEHVVIDRQRYELVADLVEERAHSVVFFNWKHQKIELMKELKARDVAFEVIDGETPARRRAEIVDAYQRGEYQTVLMHPDTGAHGLTLTRGDTTILCSPIDKPDVLKQAIHRIYRGGQTKATNTILVRAKNTIEDKVYARLDDKYEGMVDFLDQLREWRR